MSDLENCSKWLEINALIVVSLMEALILCLSQVKIPKKTLEVYAKSSFYCVLELCVSVLLSHFNLDK